MSYPFEKLLIVRIYRISHSDFVYIIQAMHFKQVF